MTSAAKTLAALMCGASAVLAAGCDSGAQQASAADAPPPLAALPLTDVSAAQARPGPVALDLPSASPARLGPQLDPRDGYAYLDRAYSLNDAFGDAPPDYGFAYANGEEPWIWQTDDGFTRAVEFLPYGARYYYYEPGVAYPFLIRDPDYGYAYADGDLVAVYDADDTLLPPEDLALHAGIAGRELARAQALYRGSRRDSQPVALGAWTSRRVQITSDLGRWRNLQDHQSAWRNYHQEHLRPEQAHWSPERFRRAAKTARIDRQIHDPDGADHALRNARDAQNVARRANVAIITQPHGRQVAAEPVEGRSSGQAGRRASELHQMAVADTVPARRLTRGAVHGPERLAMAAVGPRDRAGYDVRVHRGRPAAELRQARHPFGTSGQGGGGRNAGVAHHAGGGRGHGAGPPQQHAGGGGDSHGHGGHRDGAKPH